MNSRNAVDSKAVYANYRAAVRKLRKSTHENDWRASNRKQTALRVTSERYHPPISEVKEIVRTLDNENGIAHNHSENYLLEIDYEKAYNAFCKVQGNGPYSCSSCGTSDEASIVRVRIDEILNRTSSAAFSLNRDVVHSRGAETVFTLKCFTCWYH